MKHTDHRDHTDTAVDVLFHYLSALKLLKYRNLDCTVWAITQKLNESSLITTPLSAERLRLMLAIMHMYVLHYNNSQLWQPAKKSKDGAWGQSQW